MTQFPILSNDAHALQQRRFWNRRPMLSAAVVFGSAAAMMLLVGFVGYDFANASLDDLITFAVMVVGGIASTMLIGTIFGRFIGSTGRNRKAACVAVARGVLIAFVSFIVFWITIVAFTLADGGGLSVLNGLVDEQISSHLIVSLLDVWLIYPAGGVTGYTLYRLRTAPPRQPKVLGCGQHSNAS